MQPSITLTFTGVDITEVLLALASAGLEVPRPENTQPAGHMATVLTLADAVSGDQLELDMAPPAPRTPKQFPIPRNYQARTAVVAAWLTVGTGGHNNGNRLADVCRAHRNGRHTVLAVLDWLVLNGTLPNAAGDVHGSYPSDTTAADAAGVTIDMWRKSVYDLRSMGLLLMEAGSGQYRLAFGKAVTSAAG